MFLKPLLIQSRPNAEIRNQNKTLTCKSDFNLMEGKRSQLRILQEYRCCKEYHPHASQGFIVKIMTECLLFAERVRSALSIVLRSETHALYNVKSHNNTTK